LEGGFSLAIRALGHHTKRRSTTIYGGVSMNPQIQKLRAGGSSEERHPPGPLPAPVPFRKIIRSDRQAELLIAVPFLTTPPAQRPSGTFGQVRILAKPNQ
jgi:hypothetical protein